MDNVSFDHNKELALHPPQFEAQEQSRQKQ